MGSSDDNLPKFDAVVIVGNSQQRLGFEFLFQTGSLGHGVDPATVRFQTPEVLEHLAADVAAERSTSMILILFLWTIRKGSL